MKIRTANILDIDSIMEIENRSFLPQVREKRGLFLERLNVFSGGFILLVDESSGVKGGGSKGEKVCGYFCTERWKKISRGSDIFSVGHDISKTHCSDGPVLYISSFAVLPEFRGGGLGGKFFCDALEFIEESQQGLKEVALLVNENWSAARHIYKKNGFSECFLIDGVFENDEGQPENGIVMNKTLDVWHKD